MNPYSKRLAMYAGFTAALTVIIMAELGAILHSIKFDESKISLQDRATAVAVATALSYEGVCGDVSPLVERYCGAEAHFAHCMTAVSEVQRAVGFSEQNVIFGLVRERAAKVDRAVRMWAVDTVAENDNVYKDDSASRIVATYNNSAYFYSQKQQRQSAGCWSWSLAFWKDSSGKPSLQLVFCDHNNDRDTRVCAAFDVALRKD